MTHKAYGQGSMQLLICLILQGELAFRAVSFTPWPVEEGCEGERIRIRVGPVSSPEPRTFVFVKCAVDHTSSVSCLKAI